MRRPAFTLIELLIVVAIIAILAAIAVPNFLEAQTRAKISRVRGDMRTIATAMEAYLVDYNKYVNDSDNTLGKNGQGGLGLLTTPVAYLTTLPTDPFQAGEVGALAAINFELGSGSDNNGWRSRFGTYGAQSGTLVNSWLLMSVGPERLDSSTPTDGYGTFNNDEWPGSVSTQVVLNTYDSTNGSVSNGDIYRVGGTLGAGNYLVDGRLFGTISQ